MKKSIPYIIAALAIGAAIFIFLSKNTVDSEFDKISKERTELRAKLDLYSAHIDSLNLQLDVLEDSVDYLVKLKSEVKIKYETKVEDYSNPSIVSNDSITKYIARKIRNRY